MKLERKCWKCFYKDSRIGNKCFMYEDTDDCDYPKNEDLSDASDNFIGQKPGRQWKQIKIIVYIGDNKKPYLTEWVRSLYNGKQLEGLYKSIRNELRITQRYIEKYPVTPEVVIAALENREYIKPIDYYTKEECIIR